MKRIIDHYVGSFILQVHVYMIGTVYIINSKDNVTDTL